MAVVSLRRVREGSAPTRHTTPSTPRTRTALLTDCVCHSQVDVNKQTKRVFTRKNFVLPDHKKTVIKLDCEHRVRWCLKEEVNFPTHTLLMRACARTHPPTPNRPSTHTQLAQSFLDSQVCKDMYPGNSGRGPPAIENGTCLARAHTYARTDAHTHARTHAVMKCICDCIKECKRKEVSAAITPAHVHLAPHVHT